MNQATSLIAVFSGAGVGALCRYGLGNLVQKQSGSTFPWGTLAVNVSGCLLVGVVMALLLAKGGNDSIRTLLVTGVLGGYTTFSAFGYEAMNLLMTKVGDGLLYIAVTNLLCLTSCFAGRLLALAFLKG